MSIFGTTDVVGVTEDGEACDCVCHCKHFCGAHCAPCCDRTYQRYTDRVWEAISAGTIELPPPPKSENSTLAERLAAFKEMKRRGN